MLGLLLRIGPYLFAIWLVVMADLTAGYLRSLIDRYMERKTSTLRERLASEKRVWSDWDRDLLESERLFLPRLVSDCLLRVNFLNSMLAALVAAIAATAGAKDYESLTVVTFVLVFSYAPLLMIMLRIGPGELLDKPLVFDFWGQKRTLDWHGHHFFRLVLIGINIVLIALSVYGYYEKPVQTLHRTGYLTQSPV